MERCCICLDERYHTLIINSGLSICRDCLNNDNVKYYCPTTRIKITVKIPNDFTMRFFRLPPLFSIKDLSKSHDKIAYMDQFDEIDIDNFSELIGNGEILLNVIELKIFVSKCINLNYIDPFHREMLMKYACDEFNDLDLVKKLVEKGIDVNCVDTWGFHPIHFASKKGDKAIEIVKYLVSRGATVNCISQFGIRPIHAACERGDKALELVKFLVMCGADVNCADTNKRYPIHIACKNGDKSLGLVKYLVEKGANLSCINGCGCNPMYFALKAKYKSLELVNWILEYGVNVNCSVDYYGNYPIHLACKNNAPELVKVLMMHGANPDVKSKCGELPSDLTENEEILQLLGKI